MEESKLMLPPHLNAAATDELCRRSLLAFALQAFGITHGGTTMMMAPYIDAICHRLQQLFTGNFKRLIITVPPRHGKSELAAMAFPAWCLGQDPSIKFMVVSYGLELSRAQLNGARTLLASPRYQRIFPDTQVKVGKDRAHMFTTSAGGDYRAISTGGAVTGFGTNFMVIDDLHKADEALTPVGREAAILFYKNTLLSRFNNPSEDRILVIQQRLHEEDIVGWLLEQGGWDHLNLPAIAEKDETIPLSRGRIWQRKKGDLLHPERFPMKVLEERRLQQGNRVFGAQYQQNPIIAEGSQINLGWFGQYDKRKERSCYQKVVQSWDTAAVVNSTSDFSAGMTWGFMDGNWYLLDVIRARLEYWELKDRALAWHKQWKADALVIEGASSGFALYQDAKRGGLPGIIRNPAPRFGKVERLSAKTARLVTGDFFLPAEAPWLAELRHEMVAFPEGRHDDMVDALIVFLEFVYDHERWVKTQYNQNGRAVRRIRTSRGRRQRYPDTSGD
jgi:predicted phage terminase large subunit-like protein